MPTTQPIEKVWGTVKLKVAKNYDTADKGDAEKVIPKIIEAYHTAGLVPRQLSAATAAESASMATSYIRNSVDWANANMLDDETREKGTLGSLVLSEVAMKKVLCWTGGDGIESYLSESPEDNAAAERAAAAADDTLWKI